VAQFLPGVDRFLKFWEKHGSRALRRKASERAAEWMLARCENSDGLGAIYPPMMYAIMALDVLGYPAGPSRQPGSPLPVRAADDRRRRALPVPAVLLADLGHRHRRLRGRRIWRAGKPGQTIAAARVAPRRRLAALQRSPRKGDWSVKRPAPSLPAGILRIPQRVTTRISTTRPWSCWRSARRAVRTRRRKRPASGARSTGFWPCRSRDGGWAAFDADNNWEFLKPGPVRRPQRHARSHLPDITGRVLEALGAHGPGPDHPRREARRGLAGAQPAARWKLVRPLGRGVHLRHLLRAARPARRRKRPRSPRPARRRMAALHSERRRRLGRKLRQLRPRLLRAAAQHAIANRLGD
jgi:squalene-hopene/tetraprenyl-beta-curcumene cyclase